MRTGKLAAAGIWGAVLPAVFWLGTATRAQQQAARPLPAIAVVSFAFERAGLSVPNYVLAVAQDGSGQYAGTEVKLPERATDPPSEPQPFGRKLTVTPATARKITTLAHELHDFTIVCATKGKNIADMGRKRLSYEGPDGRGSCDYNYSENKKVDELTTIFQALAETMDEGRRLDFLHRYDRLGLDEAMEFLTEEVAAGRAIELGTIAPSLHSIADDVDVMQRVRVRASALLATIPADSSSR